MFLFVGLLNESVIIVESSGYYIALIEYFLFPYQLKIRDDLKLIFLLLLVFDSFILISIQDYCIEASVFRFVEP